MAAYDYIANTGTIVPDTSDILTEVQGEYQSALGQTINLASSTPQGSLIAGETIARTGVMKNNADLANTINPNLSYGVFLDAVCALLGVSRGTNQSTVVSGVQINGNPTTVINAGSRVQTTNGDIFVLAAAVTIPVGGTTTATFNSAAYGNIPAPVGPLTILDGTIGWGSANVLNTSTIVAGSTQLEDPQLKNKRNQTLATQGVGSAAAIQAAILNVPNVTSCKVVENNTGATGVVSGINFTLPNAIWACVAGTATPAAIAAAMQAAHNGGCPWDFGASGNGNPVNAPNGTPATDPVTGQQYKVKMTTPILYDTYVNIQVHQQTSVAAIEPAVQQAILDYANGKEQGELGFVIGASVSAFEVAGAVVRQQPGMYVKSCLVACVPAGSPAPVYPSGYSTEFVTPTYGQAQIVAGDITVVPV